MIVGLIGLKQVGKSTAATHLKENHGFVGHNFKDALVKEMKDNFPDLLHEILSHTDLYGDLQNHPDLQSVDDLFKFKPPLMRALMQNYGTEVRRGDSRNYWTKQWRLALPPKQDVVVDDVRFINEAKMVKANDGILIRLTRPDVTPTDGHSSEKEQMKIEADYTIDVEQGDHEGLYNRIDEIINQAKGM